eukprot:1158011-Pelagomonas_calceolata.AAC.9
MEQNANGDLEARGIKLVGTLCRMGMRSVSKFNGTLVVNSQLFKLAECIFCVTRSTNAQKNGMKEGFVASPKFKWLALTRRKDKNW